MDGEIAFLFISLCPGRIRAAKLTLLLCALLTANRASADPYQPYCGYLSLPALGQIVVSAGSVDMRLVDGKTSLADTLLPGATVSLALEKKAQLGKHEIRTRLSLQPPAGTGPGGGSYAGWVEISVDGHPKVDLPCGEMTQGDYSVDKIVLHAGGPIMISASNKDGRIVEPPFKLLWLDRLRPIVLSTLEPKD